MYILLIAHLRKARAVTDSPLLAVLKTEIAADGPMPLAAYMARALSDPAHGYYMTRQPLGRAAPGGGDFITAPEISQMFGELIGIWCADLWQRMGAPTPFALVELGPGRGTLMADALRAAAVLPDFSAAAHVHMVDISPVLKKAQAETVPQARLHDSLDSLPDGPMLIIANEFFDALPIAQYRFSAEGWREICVGLEGDQLVLTDGPVVKTPFSDMQAAVLPDGAKPGDIIETCPAAEAVIAQLAPKITPHGGALLAIDYGYARPAFGDSFQALEGHQMVDPLARPGLADLTAHVNFSLLAKSGRAAGLSASPVVTQGAFLTALGIDMRAQNLCASAPQRAAAIRAEQARLIGPEQMGDLFKVLALTSRDMPTPSGFSL